MSSSNWLTSRLAMFGYGVVVVAVAVIVGALIVAPLFAPKRQFADYNVDVNDVAIHGYDTVAYFTEGKATKGTKNIEHVWSDARWQFANASNRDLFKANPDRYAPQYGGYCALGLASGEIADADPNAWTFVDGKLYLNNAMKYREVWRKAPQAYFATADYNWTKNRAKLRDAY